MPHFALPRRPRSWIVTQIAKRPSLLLNDVSPFVGSKKAAGLTGRKAIMLDSHVVSDWSMLGEFSQRPPAKEAKRNF